MRTHQIQDASGVVVRDQSGDILFLHHNGAGTPAADLDGGAGYAYGCLAINANGTDESDLLYANIGTNLVADFNVTTIAGA